MSCTDDLVSAATGGAVGGSGGSQKVWGGGYVGKELNKVYTPSWTGFRDSNEAAAAVVGDYFVPGSSAITGQLTSQGAQDLLNSDLGKAAQVGTSIAGGVNMLSGPPGTPVGVDANGLPLDGGGSIPYADAGANASTFDPATGIDYGPSAFDGSGAGLGVDGGNAAASAADIAAGGSGQVTWDTVKGWVNSQTGQKVIGLGLNALGTNYAKNASDQSGAMRAQAAKASGQLLSDAALKAAGVQSDAATKSADQIVAGDNAAIGTTANTLANQTAIQQPYMKAGTDALNTLAAGLQPGGQFNRAFTMADAQNMDAYKFALDQGLQAGNNAAAAGGTRLSSANVQAQQKTAEGIAAQYQNQAFNQWLQQNNLTKEGLQNLVNTGQVSTEALNQDMAKAGVDTATLQQHIGTAQASGTTGAANATAQGITSSAGAQAAALTGAAGSEANALTNSANIVNQGVSNIGNQIASMFAPKTPTYTLTVANQSGLPPIQ